MKVRAFLVRLPSGARYWTVLDDELAVVGEADAFLRHVRFGLVNGCGQPLANTAGPRRAGQLAWERGADAGEV